MIVMFVYGVEGFDEVDFCLCVDMVMGLGNIYVVVVKCCLCGIVGIDLEVGFIEIVILVDKIVDLCYIVVDFMS